MPIDTQSYVLTSGGIGILLAAAIIWLIRKDHMHVQYSLWWMTVAVAAIVLGLFPGILDRVSRILGIAYSPSLLFLLAVVALMLKTLLADIERSRNKMRMLRLTQRLVILEQRLEELGRDNETRNRNP